MPEFPDRYITSSLIGRVDLIDVISLEEYRDTVPEKLREPTESKYQFVCRNPMYLELPQKMTGSPGIYKIEKALFYGVKDLIVKTPVSWWPPKEYRLYQLGRFDLYPMQMVSLDFARVKSANLKPTQLSVIKTNVGCFHLKSLLNIDEQQTIVKSIRELCIDQPQKYKFSKSENLAQEELKTEEADTFNYLQDEKFNTSKRNLNKHHVYVMELQGKECSDQIKALSVAVEDGTNQHKE